MLLSWEGFAAMLGVMVFMDVVAWSVWPRRLSRPYIMGMALILLSMGTFLMFGREIPALLAWAWIFGLGLFSVESGRRGAWGHWPQYMCWMAVAMAVASLSLAVLALTRGEINAMAWIGASFWCSFVLSR